MCGVAGVYSVDEPAKWRPLVEDIVQSQYRRGPDNQSIEEIFGSTAQVIFGHNRLSIIDLSAGANQPLWDAARRYCIVFNGEIYNYVELRTDLANLGHHFRTQSDTEVILEAFKEWGTAAFSRFNGMFALAIYDALNERLVLCRDRFGVKPLYFYATGQAFLFASTQKAIAQHFRLQPDLSYVSRGLHYGIYESGDAVTAYEGLSALIPGTYLEVYLEAGLLRCKSTPYYDLTGQVAAAQESLRGLSVEAMMARVEELLTSAVQLRFRADVPVGVSLSGGLDSSSVAALSAKSQNHQVIGFTFGHPGARESEGPLVAKLAGQAGIAAKYIWPSIPHIVDAYYKTLEAQEAPFPGASIVAQYMVFRAVRDSNVKVLLGGQGGDEIFMGYRKFQAFRLMRLLRQKQYVEAIAFLVGLVPTVFAELPRAKSYWRNRMRYTSPTGLGGGLNFGGPAAVSLQYDASGPLWQRQHQDVKHSSLPTLLRYEDRNSMGSSVESRLPFLDYRLVEFALALPDALKVRSGYGKWIIRQLMKGQIPDAIRLARYKRGFDVAQNQWINQGLGSAMRTSLQEMRTDLVDWLPNEGMIHQLFSDEQLNQRPAAFAEATALIWLGKRLQR